MIFAYTGKPRAGKTHELVRDINSRMKKEKDLFLWANRPLATTLDLDCGKNRITVFDRLEELNNLVDWMDLHEIRNCIIAIDEAQAYINARKWDELSEEIQYLMQTHGHYGIDVYLTTQHESRIDVLVRQLIHYLWRFRSYKLFGWMLIIGSELDTDTMDKDEKVVLRRRYWLRSPWDPILYDTHAKIDFPARKDSVVHVYKKCTSCGNERKVS